MGCEGGGVGGGDGRTRSALLSLSHCTDVSRPMAAAMREVYPPAPYQDANEDGAGRPQGGQAIGGQLGARRREGGSPRGQEFMERQRRPQAFAAEVSANQPSSGCRQASKGWLASGWDTRS